MFETTAPNENDAGSHNRIVQVMHACVHFILLAISSLDDPQTRAGAAQTHVSSPLKRIYAARSLVFVPSGRMDVFSSKASRKRDTSRSRSRSRSRVLRLPANVRKERTTRARGSEFSRRDMVSVSARCDAAAAAAAASRTNTEPGWHFVRESRTVALLVLVSSTFSVQTAAFPHVRRDASPYSSIYVRKCFFARSVAGLVCTGLIENRYLL